MEGITKSSPVGTNEAQMASSESASGSSSSHPHSSLKSSSSSAISSSPSSPSISSPPAPPLSAPESFVFTSSRYATPDTKSRLPQTLSRSLRTRHADGAIDVKYSTLPFIVGSGGFVALRSPSAPVPPSERPPQHGTTDYFSQSMIPLSPPRLTSKSSPTLSSPTTASFASYQPHPPSSDWASATATVSPHLRRPSVRSHARSTSMSTPSPPARSGMSNPTSSSHRIAVSPDHNTLFSRDVDQCLVDLIRRTARRRTTVEGTSVIISPSNSDPGEVKDHRELKPLQVVDETP